MNTSKSDNPNEDDGSNNNVGNSKPSERMEEGENMQVSNPEELANKVLTDEAFSHIHELILDYAIHVPQNRNSTLILLSPPDIRSCRLVQKAWFYSVNKCLCKAREPLFQIHLTAENSVCGTDFVRENGKLLDQFVREFGSTPDFENSVPPFSLHIPLDFFRQENHQSFVDCLTRCGSGLVELDITFPSDGGSMTFIFPALSLPILRKLHVTFTQEALPDESEETPGCNVAAIYLLQSIFTGSVDLKELEVESDYFEETLPIGFKNIRLPPTLNEISIAGVIKESDLELIASNDLPNLTKLICEISWASHEDGTLFRVMNNVRHSLEEIILEDINPTMVPIPVLTRLPVMEKLSVFMCFGTLIELEDNLSSLQDQLPELFTIDLLFQSPQMLKKWTENSIYENVPNVVISLVDTERSFDDANYFIGMNAEIIQSIHTSFPNIQSLNVTFNGDEILSGLHYVFQNLRQLQIFRITAKNTGGILNSDLWDAAFLGVSIEHASALRTKSKTWEEIQLTSNNLPSIRDMTELEDLTLITDDPHTYPGSERETLISDVSFQFAFLKMENLRNLYFRSRFIASSEMTEAWEANCRVIGYHPQ